MHYNVPQFIDIEDTVVGPLTAKQILWLFAMSAVLLFLWMVVGSMGVFIFIAIPIALVFIALAFYKPNGQPLLSFLKHVTFFFARPKIYIWKREDAKGKVSNKSNTNMQNENIKEKKDIPRREDVENLARILDSESEIIRK